MLHTIALVTGYIVLTGWLLIIGAVLVVATVENVFKRESGRGGVAANDVCGILPRSGDVRCTTPGGMGTRRHDRRPGPTPRHLVLYGR